MLNDSKDETAKVSHHLSLLRQEYNKLQVKHAQLQHQFDVGQAVNGRGKGTFLLKLLRFVAELHHSPRLSDVGIKIAGQTVPGHKFVLNARGDHWLGSDETWEKTAELDWSMLEEETAEALLEWIYKDDFRTPTNSIPFLTELLLAASQFQLADLLDRCEQQLVPSVTVSNCVELFVRAEESGAETLRKYCASLMSNHWDDLDRDNLAPLSAQSLYRLLEEHSSHPLHAAVRLGREDVVFLDLIKYNQQLPARLNAVDDKGDLVLDVALSLRYEALASCLVQHGASVDCADINGRRLLHKAVERKDAFACQFLLKNGALSNLVEPDSGRSPLHLLANWDSDEAEAVCRSLLGNGSDPNVVAADGKTPVHLAVEQRNRTVLRLLLDNVRTDCRKQDKSGLVPLWHALKVLDEGKEKEDSAARMIVLRCPSCVDSVSSVTGLPLLHMAAAERMEKACMFLLSNGVDVNAMNRRGETALHVACQSGMANLVRQLLDAGADANVLTPPEALQDSGCGLDTSNPFGDDDEEEEGAESQQSGADQEASSQSALHFAISRGLDDVVAAFVDYARAAPAPGSVDFDIRNSRGESPLCLALTLQRYSLGQLVLKGGANVDAASPKEGLNLLHFFIERTDEKAALFLLDSGVEVHRSTSRGDTPLVLSIRRGLPFVLEALCRKGCNMKETADGESPLWLALSTDKEDLASILVRYGVDTDHWEQGPDGCLQTLLHRALDENLELAACFLIRSGCDVNCTRRGGGDDDLATPLHMCATWGLTAAAMTLLEHGANVNARDSDAKTPLHTAIEQHHGNIADLLLEQPALDLHAADRQGRSAFAAALAVKNNRAATSVLARDPSVAEQYDNKGRTLLHDTVLRGDLEGLLFLLSVRVNVNCRTSDSSRMTPLHLAVQTARDEMILRNLIVAGAGVNDTGPRQQTALHMAAEREDGAAMVSILLDAGADWMAVDDSGNSALHTASRLCHVSVARIMLTQSAVDAESRNMRGQNPLHLAAGVGREAAGALLALFLECMPQYPINAPDIEGNTPLLLAYMKGNVTFCKALVRAGACLAATNKTGVSIFNYQLATKQLLVRLLEQLSEEPPWAEYDYCMECGNKFGITTRKHHCRHCGRILCSKCSDHVMPILKFNLSKPVRVCLLCSQVLSSCLPTP